METKKQLYTVKVVEPKKMSIKDAIEEVYNCQHGLVYGGLNHNYAKAQIEEIMYKFTREEWAEIKEKVQARFPDQE